MYRNEKFTINPFCFLSFHNSIVVHVFVYQDPQM